MSYDAHPHAPHPAEVAAAYAPGSLQPPHSLEAEREVLAAVFVDPRQAEHVVRALSAEAFFAERHRTLFRVVSALVERGVAVDIVTVSQALRDGGLSERVDARTIGELLDRSGTVTNLDHYVAIVRDKARLRRVIETAQAIESEAYGDVESVDEFVGRVEARWGRTLDEVAPVAEPVALRTIGDRMDDGEDWLETLPHEVPVLLRGEHGRPFMRDSRVAALIAPGGTGKTYALCDFAMAVATGSAWLGTYGVASKGKVLLALGEEDEDEIRRRLWHISRPLDLYDRAEVARNIVPLGLMGQQVAMLERTADGNIRASSWFAQFRASLEAHGPWRAIVLDPWSRWGGSDAETDANAATMGISLLESLTQLPGRPAVIVAHHTRKVMAGARLDASDTRGSSAFVDGARLVINLSRRPTGDLLELRVTKANYTMPSAPLVLARGDGGILRPATVAQIEAEREEAEEGRQSRRGSAKHQENTL